MHDNSGGWSERPMPGVAREVQPFFGYVLGNPGVRAGGRTEEEVLERIRDSLIVAADEKRPVTRKVVELDLGDHILAHDVMNG